MGLNRSPAGLRSSPITSSLSIARGFGFLIGVVADYGIPAERAWRIPSELVARLGTVEPRHLRNRPLEVTAACRARPVMHRFPDRFAHFVNAAVRQVCDEYQGVTEHIWHGAPVASELQDRFERFEGIGQKKAAMAVDLLIRELGVEVRAPSGNDVAYDVHVRRVFTRTGIVSHDSVDEVLAAARELSPERPGALDYPSWHIGRTLCRPTNPLCERCPLEFACEYAESQRRVKLHQLVLFPA